MEDMDLLLAEAQSLAYAMIQETDKTQFTADDDVKEIVQRLIRMGEETRDRLEEALDFAELEDDEVRIEDSLDLVENALDVSLVALTAEGPSALMEDVRAKVEQLLIQLAADEGPEPE